MSNLKTYCEATAVEMDQLANKEAANMALLIAVFGGTGEHVTECERRIAKYKAHASWYRGLIDAAPATRSRMLKAGPKV